MPAGFSAHGKGFAEPDLAKRKACFAGADGGFRRGVRSGRTHTGTQAHETSEGDDASCYFSLSSDL